MIESEIASIMAPMTGYLHTSIRRLDAGKETPESKKAKEERAMQETKEVQRISQIYNSQGKLIEYEESGKHLDLEV